MARIVPDHPDMKQLLLAVVAFATVSRPAPALQTGGAPIGPQRWGPVHVESGVPGGVGEVRLYDGFSGSDAGDAFALQGVGLLPIDFVGRVELLTHLPDRPRLLEDLPLASRLALPFGRGMLYHYSRREPGAATQFGYLLVRADGRRSSLVERRGLGSGGSQDPFVARIAVAPDGGSILVATRPAAMGDLLEVDLGTGRIENRTSGTGPLVFSDAGLWLGADWGFGVSSTGVWRFDRAAEALASAMTFAAGEEPTTFSGQAVMSSSREWALTTAGSSSQALHAFLFGRDGAARRASTTPAALSGAGFLPESSHGPYMAVSDDGENCAWRVEGGTRECTLARVDTHGAAGVQISEDQYYTDTLDEIGQVFFWHLKRLTLMVGGRSTGGGIEDADVFQAELASDLSPMFTNVSLSSGDALVPFLSPGTIDVAMLLRIPEASGSFLFDGKGNRVLAVFDSQTGPTLLLDQVKDVYFAERSAGWLAFAARRDYDPKPREIYRVPQTLDAAATLLVPGDSTLDYPRAWANDDGWVGYMTLVNDTFESVHRVNLVNGIHEVFPSSATAYGDALGFTPWGAMLVRTGSDVVPASFFVWPRAGQPVQLATPAMPGFFLPGR